MGWSLLYTWKSFSGWWLISPLCKMMEWKSVGMIFHSQNDWKNHPFMFQTTHQFYINSIINGRTNPRPSETPSESCPAPNAPRPAAWCPASLSARRLRRWSLEIPPEMAARWDAEVNVTCYPNGVGEILGEIFGEILGEMLLRCRCLTHQFDHLTGI